VLLNLTPGQDTLYILGRSIAQDGGSAWPRLWASPRLARPHARRGASDCRPSSRHRPPRFRPEGRRSGISRLPRRSHADHRAPRAFGATDMAGPVDTDGVPQGMLTNVLTPKCLFFLALMPAVFISRTALEGRRVPRPGATFITTGTAGAWFGLGASRVRSFFAGARVPFAVSRRRRGALIVLACGWRQASNDGPHRRLSMRKNPEETAPLIAVLTLAGCVRAPRPRACRPGRHERRQAAGGGHRARLRSTMATRITRPSAHFCRRRPSSSPGQAARGAQQVADW